MNIFKRYLDSKTVKFLLELLSRFKFLIFTTLVVTFLGVLFEGLGITILIPFFSALSGVPYEAPNRIIEFFYSLILKLKVEQNPQTLLFLIFIFFLARAFMLWLASFMQNFFGYKLSVVLRKMFLMNVYEASWPFLVKQKFGHVQFVMSRDIPQVIDFLSRGLGFLYSLLLLVVYIFFAFLISPAMTLVALGSGLVFIVLLQFLVLIIRRYAKIIVSLEKDFAHYMYQLLSGVKMVKTTLSKLLVRRQSNKFAQDFTDISLRFSAIYPLGTIFFQPLAVLIIFITFLSSYDSPGFNFGAFTVLLYLIYRVVSQAQSLQNIVQSLVNYLPHVSNFAGFHFALLKAKEESVTGGRAFEFNDALKFSNVSFSYPDREAVLKDLNFKIPKGKSVGVIGPSGSGKTTIADIILRLLDPTSGNLLLDGSNAKEYDLEEWRRNIGYVSQDPFLLQDTIRNNITLYDEEISNENIKESLKDAYINDFVDSLPNGIDTLVGDRGMELSVGQRQRIILARVFARNPKLLILDEATSALDNESELMVHKAIDNLHGKTTILTIAHRLSTIMNVDYLLVLDKSSIVEEGKPKELIKDPNSHFYKMYHASDEK